MNTRQRKTLRVGVLSALVAASALMLGACASPPPADNPGVLYYRDVPARAPTPATPSMLMDPQDRGGGGAGGGGGGGGGH